MLSRSPTPAASRPRGSSPLAVVALVAPLLVALVAPLAAAYTALSDDVLRAIPGGGDDFDIEAGELLAPILIPRIPGTEGIEKAQRHFVDFFSTQLPKWSIEWQNSTSTTPTSGGNEIPFRNLIFRRDPPEIPTGDVGRLTLVAHYDTLAKPDGFVGAIDSAAPCAMLMHVARSLDEALDRKWAEGDADSLEEGTGVQILLMDGEEAFLHWTHEDSLYGSRSLAEAWSGEYHAAMSTYQTPMDAISLFVLLDLLGSPSPNVPSYFVTTHWAYKAMAEVESRMRTLGVLESQADRPFLPDGKKASHEIRGGGIEDDHLPFLNRGVDILHIIPSPFPAGIWHTLNDDGEHLDLKTVRDWARIVTAFVAEWMDLGEYLPKEVGERRRSHNNKTEL